MSDEKLVKMGQQLAHQCSWDGLDILTVAAVALTDANFHEESELLKDIIKALEVSDVSLKYELVTHVEM